MGGWFVEGQAGVSTSTLRAAALPGGQSPQESGRGKAGVQPGHTRRTDQAAHHHHPPRIRTCFVFRFLWVSRPLLAQVSWPAGQLEVGPRVVSWAAAPDRQAAGARRMHGHGPGCHERRWGLPGLQAAACAFSRIATPGGMALCALSTSTASSTLASRAAVSSSSTSSSAGGGRGQQERRQAQSVEAVGVGRAGRVGRGSGGGRGGQGGQRQQWGWAGRVGRVEAEAGPEARTYLQGPSPEASQ